MGLESSFDNIDDLNSTWPLGTDPKSEGDNHIAGIKRALQANVGGDGLITQLYAQSVVAADASAFGFNVYAGATFNPQIRFHDELGVRQGRVRHDGADIELRNEFETGLVTLTATPTDGGLLSNLCFSGNPDAGATMFWVDDARLSTTLDGAEVTSPLTTYLNIVSENTTPGFDADAALALRGATNGGARFQWDEDLETLKIRATEADGTTGLNWIEGVKGKEVALCYGGPRRLETTAGGGLLFERDWVQEYASTASVRFSIRNSEGGAMLKHDGGITNIMATDAAGVEGLRVFEGISETGAGFLFFGAQAQLFTTDRTLAEATSGAKVRSSSGTNYDVGFNITPVVGSAVPITLDGDTVGHMIRKGSGGGDVTVPATGTPNGSMWMISNQSGADINILASGITLEFMDGINGGTGNRVLPDNGVATVMQRTATIYMVWGIGLR